MPLFYQMFVFRFIIFTALHKAYCDFSSELNPGVEKQEYSFTKETRRSIMIY